MRHWVQYHNPERYGEFQPSERDFGIVTSKKVDSLVGDRVWLVSRRGKPTIYVLCETFIVESVGSEGSEPHRNFARASQGQPFKPPVRISDEDWFLRLRRLTQNFRRGLFHIKDEEIVEGLMAVSARTPR